MINTISPTRPRRSKSSKAWITARYLRVYFAISYPYILRCYEFYLGPRTLFTDAHIVAPLYGLWDKSETTYFQLQRLHVLVLKLYRLTFRHFSYRHHRKYDASYMHIYIFFEKQLHTSSYQNVRVWIVEVEVMD